MPACRDSCPAAASCQLSLPGPALPTPVKLPPAVSCSQAAAVTHQPTSLCSYLEHFDGSSRFDEWIIWLDLHITASCQHNSLNSDQHKKVCCCILSSHRFSLIFLTSLLQMSLADTLNCSAPWNIGIVLCEPNSLKYFFNSPAAAVRLRNTIKPKHPNVSFPQAVEFYLGYTWLN